MEEEQEDNNVSQIRTSPYSSPMFNYGSGIVHLTNPQSSIKKLEMALRLKAVNEDGKEITIGDPLMNDEGIKAIIGLAESIVNQITIMGNIEKDEKMKFGLNAIDTATKMLMISKGRYEIKNPEITRTMINTYLANIIFITMNRAINEGDRRFWKGSTQEITQRVETQQKKKGMFDIFRRS